MDEIRRFDPSPFPAERYDWRKTLTKIAARGLTSGALVAVAAAASWLDSGTLDPRFMAFVPFAHAALAGASNWLKNREAQ